MFWRHAGRVAAALALLAGPHAGAAPANPAKATSVNGTVTRVVDGDTLIFTPAGQAPVTVRLRDIDAPEICQEGGAQSQKFLSELALNKPATLQAQGHDTYGRTVGVVMVDDVNLGPRMVEEGQAWSVRSRFDQGPLVKQERMAKALGRGFHTQAGKVMPWDFRKAHGPCTEGAPKPGAGSAPPVAVAAVSPAGSQWRCDGRTRCSQMHSCEEAKFFLANCPGVKMDGNRDGMPCEKQWCGRLQ